MTCKSRMHEFCIINAIGGCPCVRQGHQCSKRCRCFNCNNDARNSNGKPDGCRCGEGDKNIRVHAPMCRTNNDPNALAILLLVRVPRKDVNATASRTPLAKERRAGKICTSSPLPLKKKRVTDFLKESNSSISLGSWTNTETCLNNEFCITNAIEGCPCVRQGRLCIWTFILLFS